MVIVHPEYAILILELNDLREEIADLIVERDMLQYFVCKDIKIDYILKIGALEYKLIIAKNDLARALRKLELIEEKIKKSSEIDIEKIDRKIAREFKEKTKAEKEMLEDIDFAIEVTGLEMFDYEFIEKMSMDYYKIQKKHNPLFELEFSEDDIKDFEKIENYYRKANYQKLHKLAQDCNEDEMFQDEISNMKKLKDRYYEILEEVQRQIRKIKNTFPYNQKVILDDENLCRRKKDNLNREINKVKAELKKAEKEIKNKLKKL